MRLRNIPEWSVVSHVISLHAKPEARQRMGDCAAPVHSDVVGSRPAKLETEKSLREQRCAAFAPDCMDRFKRLVVVLDRAASLDRPDSQVGTDDERAYPSWKAHFANDIEGTRFCADTARGGHAGWPWVSAKPCRELFCNGPAPQRQSATVAHCAQDKREQRLRTSPLASLLYVARGF
ncbi:hypothetical protein AAFG13_37730 [Bradyrhizobium sp. B124]|uniref:hypothetical protein n=1 Tax=Bradyrhizobium sp. B124 TaxID=3140245 RepID=UPI0031843605